MLCSTVALPCSSSLSSAALTVTVCATFQLRLVKVSVAGLSVRLVSPLSDGVTVTLAVGALVSFTV